MLRWRGMRGTQPARIEVLRTSKAQVARATAQFAKTCEVISVLLKYAKLNLNLQYTCAKCAHPSPGQSIQMSYCARPAQERLAQTDSQVLGFPQAMDFGTLRQPLCANHCRFAGISDASWPRPLHTDETASIRCPHLEVGTLSFKMTLPGSMPGRSCQRLVLSVNSKTVCGAVSLSKGSAQKVPLPFEETSQCHRQSFLSWATPQMF